MHIFQNASTFDALGLSSEDLLTYFEYKDSENMQNYDDPYSTEDIDSYECKV